MNFSVTTTAESHTENSEDLFQPQSVKLTLMPRGLMEPHVKLFWSSFGQKDPKETVKAQNRTPFFPNWCLPSH